MDAERLPQSKWYVGWLPACECLVTDDCVLGCSLQRYSALPELSDMVRFPLRSARL